MPHGSRGKPKASLRTLSQQHPTREEANAVLDSFDNAPPTAVAILGASVLDYDLERLLRSRLRCDDSAWLDLSEEGGPLGTFSRKITLGFALRAYNSKVRHNLNIVRKIRNVFAHAKMLLNFGNKLIVAELRTVQGLPRGYSLDFAALKEGKADEAKSAYITLCLRLSNQIHRVELNSMKGKARRLEAKTALVQQNTFSNYLANYGGPQARARLARALVRSQGLQTGDPSHEAYQGWQHGPVGPDAPEGGSEGK